MYNFNKKRWLRERTQWYRTKNKYQKADHHRKKKVSEKEERRQDWRTQKRFKRDSKKRGWTRSSCPKWIMKAGHHEHRSWVRQNIHRENWEELMNYKKLKFINDPWRWD